MRNACKHLFHVVMTSMIVLTAGECQAWEGVTPWVSTHGRITGDAVDYLKGLPPDSDSQRPYPDIEKFVGQLGGGATTEDAHDIPTDGYLFQVWKPPRTAWWEGHGEGKWGVLDLYETCDFSLAYREIGHMIHLVQDEFSPAHIQWCFHGQWPRLADNLELAFRGTGPYFGYSYASRPHWTFTDGNGRTWFYWLSDAEDDDIDNPPEVDGPGPSGPAKENYGMGNTCWGTYGWGWRPAKYDSDGYLLEPEYLDLTPGRNEGEDGFPVLLLTANDIAIGQVQLGSAREQTIAEMKLRSEALPPIIPVGRSEYPSPSVSDLRSTNGIFGPGLPVDVEFMVLENRQKAVRVSISVEGSAIKDDAESPQVWDLASRDLVPDETPGELPWKGTFKVKWSGKLGSGNLSDGPYTIDLLVKDTDGNPSKTRHLTVKYDGTAPTAAVSEVD